MCIFCDADGGRFEPFRMLSLEMCQMDNPIPICLDHIALLTDIAMDQVKFVMENQDIQQGLCAHELTLLRFISEFGLQAYDRLKIKHGYKLKNKEYADEKEMLDNIFEECSIALNSSSKKEHITNEDKEEVVNTSKIEPATELESELPPTEKKVVDINNPKEIKSYLDDYVIGQDEAKKALAVAVSDHYRRINNPDITVFRKSNILIVGPSGSGKTLLGEKIGELLNVPFVAADASSLTAEGYVGKSPDSILKTLYYKAKGDIKLVEKGIIYLDEIDKIAAHKSEGVDVGGSCVQDQLLRMLQGDEITIQVGTSPMQSRKVTINTRNILFICSGAFEGLDEIYKKAEKQSIGFASKSKEERKTRFRVPTTKDLIEYGMNRQFLGRFSVITAVETLTLTQMKYIITRPKDALLKEYRALFYLDDIKLSFTDGALDEISKAALDENVGARGIKRIMEGILQPYRYNITDYKKSKEIKITKREVADYLKHNQLQIEN